VQFQEILRNYREHRWEPSELNGGKLCETAYTIVRGYADSGYPAKPAKPANMLAACQSLEKEGNRIPRSIRLQIPRLITFLYEVRNNRGIGHVGGDVDPNAMDAALVVAGAKWLMSELVRVFHDVDTATAQATVERLTERTIPIVWEVGGQRRVLEPSMKMNDKMLILLYSATGPVAERNLVEWIEHSNPSVFRRDVIRAAHKMKLVEYDEKAKTVAISPVGIRYVEANLPLDTS